MSTEQNKAIVRRFLEDYTPAVVDDLLVPNYIAAPGNAGRP